MADLVAVFVMVLTAPLPASSLTLPSFGPAVGLVKALDGVLPVHEALELFRLGIEAAVIVFGFRLIMWIYSVIPFKGT